MTLRFYISILSICFCLVNALFSCGQSSGIKPYPANKNVPANNSDTFQLDTSRIAVILFNTNKYNPFDGSYKQTNLTKEDLNNVEKLLIESVNDYNNSLDSNHKRWSIDLKKLHYSIQLMPALSKNGEREVWVNCLCDTMDNDRWKTEIILVDNGGNYYFNFKINLTNKTWKYFSVNGSG